MSETVTCEVCGKEGRRHLSRFCPIGWLYGQSKIEGENDSLVTIVCSDHCASRYFRQGGFPGEIRRDREESVTEQDPSKRWTALLQKAFGIDEESATMVVGVIKDVSDMARTPKTPLEREETVEVVDMPKGRAHRWIQCEKGEGKHYSELTEVQRNEVLEDNIEIHANKIRNLYWRKTV